MSSINEVEEKNSLLVDDLYYNIKDKKVPLINNNNSKDNHKYFNNGIAYYFKNVCNLFNLIISIISILIYIVIVYLVYKYR